MPDPTASRLRQLLASTPRGRGRGHGYPPALRVEVLAYVATRRAVGVGLSTVARELGTHAGMLACWETDHGRAPFRAVGVASPPVSVVIHGPGGLRVEGLDLDGVVALWRRLGA